MKVSRIDENGDWVFGRGEGNYATGNKAIEINIITKLRSFQNDWFLNILDYIDWYTLLSINNNEKLIKDAIATTVLNSQGVLFVNLVDIDYNRELRKITIKVKFVTIYNKELSIVTGVEV